MPEKQMAFAGAARFALNQPQACADWSTHTYLLLILIHTTIDNYDRREASRETWTGYKASDHSVVVLYSINENMEHGDSFKHKLLTLQKESDLYHDIILSNFSHSDRFSNLLVPSTVWISKFCPYASHVLITFDNSVVDLFKLVPFLRSVHSTNGPVLMCDYLMPYEMTIYNNDLATRENGVCSYSSFITTPSIMKKLMTTKVNNQDILKNAWLSDICNFASIPMMIRRRLFSGSRKKPSMLKELMAANYLESDIMIAIVRSPIPGRESILMRQAWLLIKAHHDKAKIQEQVSFDSPESGSIVKLAAILMLIDLSVIFVIFALIFCKRRMKSFCIR